MVAVILGMLFCVALAVVVVGIVAIPARREGREVLTPRGERVVARVVDRTGSTVENARGKSDEAPRTAHDAARKVKGRLPDQPPETIRRQAG